jgi:tRNA pseudouridine32 synthase/23S rRNA pseudouridine746 synthase
VQNHFQHFSSPIGEIELPSKFTFPFYYEPHVLCEIAAKELQAYLLNQTDFSHNFGLNAADNRMAIGKMFGVLVVQNEQGKIGYISAVSGMLGDKNQHERFVPPVYDMLSEDSHYLNEKEYQKNIHHQIISIENDPAYVSLLLEKEEVEKKAAKDILEKKEDLKASKMERDLRRRQAKPQLSVDEFNLVQIELNKESLEAKQFFNNVNRYWKHTLRNIDDKLLNYNNQLAFLKAEQKNRSNKLQQYINEQYQFLNSKKEVKNLSQLFAETAIENLPAGSGECAAPKLLQYAFLNNLKPIAMAEFWWGKSPNKEIKKHEQYYPACQGKCKPILAHMLDGIEMDENPMLENTAIGKELEIIFEDDDLLVVCKPAEFLSVPGIHVKDSVYTRIKQQVKGISGPIIVHRLDMSTSGLLVLAKNKRAHQYLQKQFIERTVKKRYTALLNGDLKEDSGTIKLPLRGDLDDRPRQLVCFEHGKPAETNWEVIERMDGRTKVHFYPVSGRTHQLRIHAAHVNGLNASIVGDDLYGTISNRLYLHSDMLEFTHPMTKELMKFQKEAAF